jgi:hypothetical protein
MDEWTSCLGEAVRVSSVLEATIVQSTQAALAPQSVSLQSEYYDYNEFVRNFRLYVSPYCQIALHMTLLPTTLR